MEEQRESKRNLLGRLLALPAGLAALAVAGAPRPAEAGSSDIKSKVKSLLEAHKQTDARQQISEVLCAYARGWDRRDEESLLSCFWPDSAHQHGGFKGLSHDFVKYGLKAVEKVRSMSHLITNISIVVNDDHAVSECYFLAHHRRPKADGDGEEDFFVKGRYIDRFERREGRWKIVKRIGLSDFSRIFPADTSLDGAPAEQLSGRKPDDPLYAALAELHGG